MTEQMYYIWLSQCFYYGSYKPFEIASKFDDLKQFYDMSAEEMQQFNFLEKNDIISLKRTSIARVENIMKDCEELSINIVTIRDSNYPKSLLRIYGVPVVLYYKGNIGILNERLSIAIVGTRKINPYSEKITFLLSRDLSELETVVISGGAMGVDGVAHAGALSVGGQTVAVMGCGVDVNYPSQNAEQRKEILNNNGALISELPPKTTTKGNYFPIRNRIISGLAQGVCVTHAPIRSGALITANYAVDQGKELFCLPPWDITDNSCMGVMKYIRDGCKVIGGVDDILSELTLSFLEYDQSKTIQDYFLKQINNMTDIKPSTKASRKNNKSAVDSTNHKKVYEEKSAKEKSAKEEVVKEESAKEVVDLDIDNLKENLNDFYGNLDELNKKVFNCLSQKPRLVDEIMLETGIQISTVLSILTDFEMEGIVTSHSGRRYSFNLNR